MPMNRYEAALHRRSRENLFRKLPKALTGIDFYSNDYLGFSKNKYIIKEIEKIIQKTGAPQTGATGSRLLSGNNNCIESLETNIAYYHGVEAALVLNSGYTANLGLLSCIASEEDTLIMDELCHASLIDGARLSKAKRLRFRHNDLADLELKLSNVKGSKFVVVESIYSMDGDICPLTKMVQLCKKYKAKLIVDEAHGIGVIGQKGEGLVCHLKMQAAIFATVVTYGKAMGAHGAAILGKQWLKDYLINFSRPFIFTTAPSFHQIVAIHCSYRYLPIANTQRKRLQHLIQYLNRKKQLSSFEWLPAVSQIQSVIIPGNQPVIEAAQHLQNKGIAAMAIRYPSVAKGTERIRICLHTYNTEEEIDHLFEQLKQWHNNQLS